jgi:hypothetical protein
MLVFCATPLLPSTRLIHTVAREKIVALTQSGYCLEII